MKYLKYFESLDRLKDIKIFCEEHLIYLLDAGFKFEVKNFNNAYIIDIYKHTSQYTYQELKDYIIPFLDILKDNYTIAPINDINTYDIYLNGNGLYQNDLENLDITNLVHSMPHLKYIQFLIK